MTANQSVYLIMLHTMKPIPSLTDNLDTTIQPYWRRPNMFPRQLQISYYIH